MINLHRVRVTFNPGTAIETHALRDLELVIPDGQFVTVIGSNGAGKSTLLNTIAGETPCDSGKLTIAGADVTRWSTAKRSALVARVFQDPMAGTCEGLSIEENLALACSRGRSRGFRSALTQQVQQRFRAALSSLDLGLENRLRDKMGLLSGGQRQAVSLLMATMNPMKILLLDEHTAALDPKTAAFVMQLTEQIVGGKGLTTLMVTHSMRKALEHGRRTVMLHEGRVVLDVTGEERRQMKVDDLLRKFEQVRGEALDEDRLLLD